MDRQHSSQSACDDCYAPALGALSDDARLSLTSVCLSVAYIVNIYGAHSYWKQFGALGAAGQA